MTQQDVCNALCVVIASENKSRKTSQESSVAFANLQQCGLPATASPVDEAQAGRRAVEEHSDDMWETKRWDLVSAHGIGGIAALTEIVTERQFEYLFFGKDSETFSRRNLLDPRGL